jgi:polysaccharide biosynthesis/export protein
MNIISHLKTLAFLFALVLLASCSGYKKSIMFRVDEPENARALQNAVIQADKNYKLRQNDLVDVKVYTNKGELLVDPTHDLARIATAPGAAAPRVDEDPNYVILPDGRVRLPMVGYVKLDGYTVGQADSMLQIKYSEHYVDAFVKLRVLNNRVVILGAMGTMIVPLPNPNTNLIEVLATVGSGAQAARLQSTGTTPQIPRMDNIRLIRGDLKKPSVQLIDLSTIDGLTRTDLAIQPNDIIYVEPLRMRLVGQAIRDYSPILGVVTSIISVIVLLNVN